MSARLRGPIAACTKGGVRVHLPEGTFVRGIMRVAGDTHFLASSDGKVWAPYYTRASLDDSTHGN